MSDRLLIIGNKNYSSWSLRPWLVLRRAEIEFDERRLPLFTPEWEAEIGKYSPTGKVPVLVEGDLVVWESLAICEYLAETHPRAQLWPSDARARAVARAVSAEMHSSFHSLREELPMNCRARITGIAPSRATREDIQRIEEIWRDCRVRFGQGGPFLFGAFSIADAMFAPVATRLRTYEVRVGEVAQCYVDTVLRLPEMRAWLLDAEREPEVMQHYERGA